MQIRSVVAVVALGLASFAHGQSPAVQWRIQDGGNGHWYQGVIVSPSGASWTTSRTLARSRGGDLVSLNTTDERVWVYSIIASRSELWSPTGIMGPWVGGFQPDGSAEPAGGWQWVDGTSVTNSIIWGAGQPDNAVSCGGANNWMSFFTDYQGGPRDLMNDDANVPVVICPGGSLGAHISAIIEWSADCNGDGIVDYGQILDGTFEDVNSNGVPDSCDVPVQWRIEDGGNGHWYQVRLNPGGETWFQCRDRALAEGGHLATATSSAENLFIFDLASQTYGAFNSNTIQAGPFLGGYQPIGAGEPAAGWQWVTGEPWGFSQWDAGQPDNYGGCGQAPGDRPGEHYLQFIYASSDWNDMSAAATCFGGSKPSYVVEWSADCNGDGVVDYGQILDGTFDDVNGTGIPDICECLADITGGGVVDAIDLAAILGAWGTPGQGKFDSDINDDGTVDAQDLAIVLGGWGNCP
jgi:hypothetical protein